MTVACSTAVRCNSPLQTALTDIAAAGFTAIDLLAIDGWVHVHPSALVADFAQTIAPLDALLQQHQLQPIALNTGVGPQLHDRSPAANERRTRETAALIRLMQHLNVQIAVIQPRQPDSTRPWDAVLADCAQSLGEQLAAAQAAGITFVLELHINSPFETLEQARQALDAVPELGIVYDPTHFVMQGVPVRQTGWLLERAYHVHLRDAAPGAIQAPFGQGTVDFAWVLGTLQERGYRGHISIEYLETSDFDTLDSALRLQELITRYF